ncbi:lactoylglutathione lyase [Halosimplex carlsbadense 2-9-1]|uniref:Lactoylglutathione lyase n=1 Tax=Halosimplex carlsbadense 2-9-1 TaxID=797114 RepID=M0CQZ3_9EURY|nr:methylmalonyl-CoA epimerase [Halosimplex carlsbadense]ELZ25680.1 lactoylglutathione lyase [Halosimplex carlsbadense 2-9-1]
MEFDHAGIATDDRDALVDQYGAILDASVAHEETFGELRVAFLDLGNGYFELLEPTADAEGPIPNFLDARGAGIHHLALRTDDIGDALDRARAAEVALIDEQPRPGAWGHEVAFLHPESTGGVLIEFVEH